MLVKDLFIWVIHPYGLFFFIKKTYSDLSPDSDSDENHCFLHFGEIEQIHNITVGPVSSGQHKINRPQHTT